MRRYCEKFLDMLFYQKVKQTMKEYKKYEVSSTQKDVKYVGVDKLLGPYPCRSSPKSTTASIQNIFYSF